MRESFIFYKSFYESIKELDPQDQVQIYNAIFEYQFNKTEPKLSGVCKSIFTLILPQLEANNKRYENGKKGGRPKQKETKIKPKNNQNKTKPKPNVNVNDNVNENVNVNDINNSSSISKEIYDYAENNFGRILTPVEIDKIDGWLKDYKEEIIKYAIRIAVLNNKKTFNYVNGILNNWKSSGYKTLQEIKENAIKIKEENPDIDMFEYDWLNEED